MHSNNKYAIIKKNNIIVIPFNIMFIILLCIIILGHYKEHPALYYKIMDWRHGLIMTVGDFITSLGGSMDGVLRESITTIITEIVLVVQ